MAEFKSKLFPQLPEQIQTKITAMRDRLKFLEQVVNKPWLYKGDYAEIKGEDGSLDPNQQKMFKDEKFKLQASLYLLEKEHGLTEEAKAWAYQFFPRSPTEFGVKLK